MNTQTTNEEKMKKAVLNVTHDLRSPLLTVNEIIARYADVMCENDLNAILAATTRANNICEETLAEVGLKNKVDPANANIHACLWGLVNEYNTRGVTKGQYLEFNSLISSHAEVNLTETRIKQMVSNLIENSLRAIGEKGRVQVDLKEHEGFVVISVLDNGCGIPTSKLHKIGQYGVTFSKGGHGFGLWNVQQTLQKIGGDLQIRSIEGVGTEVILLIPKKSAKKASLDLSSFDNFVLIDDDELIHEMMDFCLDSIGFKGPRYFLKSEKEFNDFMSKMDAQSLDDTCFVIDANLGKNNPVGLNLIQGYGIAQQSLLFTGDSQLTDISSQDLRVRCKTESPFEFLKLEA